jgi:hypothetical protein
VSFSDDLLIWCSLVLLSLAFRGAMFVGLSLAWK